jgi:hypothetical protein
VAALLALPAAASLFGVDAKQIDYAGAHGAIQKEGKTGANVRQTESKSTDYFQRRNRACRKPRLEEHLTWRLVSTEPEICAIARNPIRLPLPVFAMACQTESLNGVWIFEVRIGTRDLKWVGPEKRTNHARAASRTLDESKCLIEANRVHADAGHFRGLTDVNDLYHHLEG